MIKTTVDLLSQEECVSFAHNPQMFCSLLQVVFYMSQYLIIAFSSLLYIFISIISVKLTAVSKVGLLISPSFRNHERKSDPLNFT